MTVISLPLPVNGLSQLSNETRVIATPWSRMVRGIGLGQHPIPWDRTAADRIRQALGLLSAKGTDHAGYALFARLLTELVLDVEDPLRTLTHWDLERRLGPVLAAIRSEENAYFQVMAGCILMDTFAKLHLNQSLLVNAQLDFPAEVLAGVDAIEPDAIEDENAGRHGHYEKLSASTAVFLALGELGLGQRLVTAERNRVAEALELLDSIPSPFFRGRGGSMLLSVIALLGHGRSISGTGRDHIEEVLSYLDRADELNLPPAFPQPMSAAFTKAYPLLTMLNAISLSDRSGHYLRYGRDRLAEAKELMGRLTPVERTHMGLYYLIALHNLGKLDDQVPDLDALVTDIVGQWEHIDPGANYFLNGIAYAYIIQTAMLTGRMDLISEETLSRLVDGFPALNRTVDDRVNRAYPFAYSLNVLAEIGAVDLLFESREFYDGSSPIAWVVDQLSAGGREEPRLYMLNHALLSYALRLRGRELQESALFRNLHWL